MRLRLPIAALLLGPLSAGAGELAPEPGALAAAVAAAVPGETLRLAPGIHEGAVEIDRPLAIDCAEGAAIDGGGRGSALTVTAPGVAIRGCEIRGSGDDHQEIDAGVRLLEGATGAVVEGNRLVGNLYGVDVHGARDALVTGNVILGRDDHRMNDRGNGVYVWNAPGARVIGNDIRQGRDGIFVNTSKRNVFRGNRFAGLRFAVHYMYAHDGVVADNVSVGNHIGYAIMYSRGVEVRGNLSLGDRDHGIMLNYANEGTVRGNYVRGTGDRALFVYNAHKNAVHGNRIEGAGIGVHFTAGSERNAIAGNAFVGNRMQVKYVGSKWVEWSEDGRGNHWSDHAAYDLDGDGIADAPYRPNDVVDRVLWTQPAARLLLGSPAVQLVRWAQSAFPATLPGGVIDRHPLMAPVRPPAMERAP